MPTVGTFLFGNVTLFENWFYRIGPCGQKSQNKSRQNKRKIDWVGMNKKT